MLAAIVDGRAGFAELSRGFWRKQGAAQFIVDGNEKTCVPDSFMVAARNEDIIIPKTELYNELVVPCAGKEVLIGSMISLAREKVRIALLLMAFQLLSHIVCACSTTSTWCRVLRAQLLLAGCQADRRSTCFSNTPVHS